MTNYSKMVTNFMCPLGQALVPTCLVRHQSPCCCTGISKCDFQGQILSKTDFYSNDADNMGGPHPFYPRPSSDHVF